MTKHSAATHAKTRSSSKAARAVPKQKPAKLETKGGVIVPTLTPGEQAIEDRKQQVKDERLQNPLGDPQPIVQVPVPFKRMPRTPRDLAIQTKGVKTDESRPIYTATVSVGDEYVLAGEFKDNRGNTWRLSKDSTAEAVKLSPKELETAGSDPGLFGLPAESEPLLVEGAVEKSRIQTEGV